MLYGGRAMSWTKGFKSGPRTSAEATINCGARSRSANGPKVSCVSRRGFSIYYDTIFVRDVHDVITYWNRGAEEMFGWKSEEALGWVSHQLLQTVFPAELAEINAELLGTDRWSGELIHS